MNTKIEQRQALAEFRRGERAANLAERAEERRQRRADRGARRAARTARAVAVARRLRPVLPISLVTGLAMYGQVVYALAAITPPEWVLPLRLLLACSVAVAVESIALYVQWHAHDALLHNHTLTAARQRRVSYLLAFGVATVNYSHFAAAGWNPTPAAVCFALFSAAGPWLWGLHTRRAQRVQLSREGQLDSTGAVFAAERYRWFPIRTVLALRWSIDHGVTDPRLAWEGFKADHERQRAARRARRAARAAERAARRPRGAAQPPEPPPIVLLEDEFEALRKAVEAERAAEQAAAGGIPDRRAAVDVERDGAVIDDLRAIAGRTGRRYSRDEVKDMYGMGSPRATRLLNLLGWLPRAAEQAAAGGEA
jgi:hypothetical protein